MVAYKWFIFYLFFIIFYFCCFFILFFLFFFGGGGPQSVGWQHHQGAAWGCCLLSSWWQGTLPESVPREPGRGPLKVRPFLLQTLVVSVDSHQLRGDGENTFKYALPKLSSSGCLCVCVCVCVREICQSLFHYNLEFIWFVECMCGWQPESMLLYCVQVWK